MKKSLSILLSAILMMACSCGSDDPAKNEEPGNNPGTEQPKPGPGDDPAASTLSFRSVLKQIAEAPSCKMLVCAHRSNTYSGIRGGIPENSIAAIRNAIKEGVDMIELDPRSTSDGVLVIMHNASINATTNGTGNVAQMTAADINRYFLKAGNTVTSEKVPTLSEALDAAKNKILVCLDVKDFAALDRIVAMVMEKGMSNQVCYYTGSSTSYLDQIKRMDKTAILFPWVSDPATLPVLKRFYTGLQMVQFNIDATNINALASSVIDNGFVGYANHLTHDVELISGKYTTLQKFIDLNVRVAQTDYSDLMIPYLKGKGLRLD